MKSKIQHPESKILPAPPVGAQSSEHTAVATGTLSLVPSLPSVPSDAAALGSQLTAQYHRAVSGMREVLIFGAMLKQVEQQLAPSVHVRTLGGKMAGSEREGGGLKGWLERHAPEISRPTALRFLGVTEAIAEDYKQIVGAKVANAYDLPSLVLADASTLDAHAALMQGELFDYVSGTSQRSWLDRYKPAPEGGGGGGPGRPKLKTDDELTPEEAAALVEGALRKEISEVMDSVERFTRKKYFQVWNDAELDYASVLLHAATDAVDAWRKLPKGKRLATAIQDSIREWSDKR